MDTRGYIEVTEIDVRLLVQVAYSGSRPQGLGFLHAQPGGLDEATLNEILERSQQERTKGTIHLDYVHGRSMKFHVMVDEATGKKYVDLDWYDHGRESTKRLVRECQVPDVEARIAAAEAGKLEKKIEWETKQDTAAKSLCRMAVESGGTVYSDREPFAEYFKLKEGDPVYDAWAFGRQWAVDKGWMKASKDRQAYTLTDEGRAAV